MSDPKTAGPVVGHQVCATRLDILAPQAPRRSYDPFSVRLPLVVPGHSRSEGRWGTRICQAAE